MLSFFLTPAEVKLRSPFQKEFLAWQVSHGCGITVGAAQRYRHSVYSIFFPSQTWDLLQIMCRGFTGLCEEFLSKHPGYLICPLHINGSAVESIFSCLKFIAGGNLASTNYASSLAAMATQRDVSKNPRSEPGYRSEHIKFH